jgi:hypothetical protein
MMLAVNSHLSTLKLSCDAALAYALDEAAYQDYLQSIQNELSSRQSTLAKAWPQAHKQQFMTRYGIPIASVGNNRVRTFMADLHEAIAAQGLA